MSDERGPGHTKFYASEDGKHVMRCLNNDPAWVSPVVHDEAPLPAWKVASMLQDAYNLGKREQQEIIRRAIGASSK
ncbi:hypothetical protein Ccr5_gp022 [Caulobacter phage Ccr5]|nr:hypothetical protein Ccr5_gp022 [Caulobacter phage Ccr5]